MKQVTINLPNVGEGQTVEVPGLGLFENNTTTEVDDERVAVYTDAFGYEWPEGSDELVVELPPEPEPEEVPEEAPVVEEQEPAPEGEEPVDG